MKNGSFFIPREQIFPFFNPGAMNNEEGIYLCWETAPDVARRVLMMALGDTPLGHYRRSPLTTIAGLVFAGWALFHVSLPVS